MVGRHRHRRSSQRGTAWHEFHALQSRRTALLPVRLPYSALRDAARWETRVVRQHHEHAESDRDQGRHELRPEDIEGLFNPALQKGHQNSGARQFSRACRPSAQASRQRRRGKRLTNVSLESNSRKSTKKRKTGELLFKTLLEKSLFSSPAACLATIEGRIKRTQERTDPARFDADVTALQDLAAQSKESLLPISQKYQALLEMPARRFEQRRLAGLARDR